MPDAETTTTTRPRRYDIDALRVFAFGLLILYHVGMYYVADWDFHIKSTHQAPWLQLPMLVSNQFRMPLLFLISGLAMNFVWNKYSPLVLALRRVWRLLLPLIFGMAVVIVPQDYYEALANHAIPRGFGHFFLTYLTGGTFPPMAYDSDPSPGWTWNHLWYLPYLLCYTLSLIPVAMVLDRFGRPVRRAFGRLRGGGLIIIPILPLVVCGTLIYPHFPYINHALFDDWYAHAMYFTFFFYGFLIGRDAALWHEILQLRNITLPLAAGLFVAFYLIVIKTPDGSFAGQTQLGLIIVYLNRWVWIVAVLGWGYRLLNRPFAWLPYATEAVYPWYVLHQTILIAAAYELSQAGAGPVLEPILVIAATVIGCLVLHEFVIRRLPLLRVLFGLSANPRQPRRPRVAEVRMDTSG